MLTLKRPALISTYNMEFSCPAVSTQRYMELPDCTRRSTQPLRGQLQRFVIHPPYY
jgi:hypothetical protein